MPHVSRPEKPGETCPWGTILEPGHRAKVWPAVFYGLRIVSTLIMLGASLTLQSSLPSNPAMKIALLGFGTASGWILPRFILEKCVAKRQEPGFWRVAWQRISAGMRVKYPMRAMKLNLILRNQLTFRVELCLLMKPYRMIV